MHPCLVVWTGTWSARRHRRRSGTKVFVSPDRLSRAYAEVQISHDPNLSDPCRTDARLLVSSKHGPFKIVLREVTSEKEEVSVSLGPVAWSKNSRWLAVERLVEVYASDAGGMDVRLYDARTGRISTPDIAAIGNSLPGCEIFISAIRGFDRKNRLVLSVSQSNDPPGEGACPEETRDWVFSPLSGDLQLRSSAGTSTSR